MAGVDDLLDGLKNSRINSGDAKSFKVELKGISESHQSYFNWIDHERFEEGGVTAKELIEILEDRFLETTGNRESALKYNCVELIADKGTSAYFNSFIGNHFEAKSALADARDFIQLCSKDKFSDEEHLTGFDYVLDCFELYMDTIQPEVNHELWRKLPIFDEFDEKTKAGVFALKFYFYCQLWNDLDQQLEVSEKMVSLDPGHFEWHLCKASILRYKRRHVKYDFYQPFDPALFTEEIHEIELAKSYAPDNPLCNLELCQVLAEVMKSSKRNYKDWRAPLKCGGFKFSSAEATVSYLKKETSNILEQYQQSVSVNVTVADIFLKWIPQKHRDFKLVKECLQRALELHPTSSKVNHRLAKFHMGPDSADITKAERFCILAVQYDPRNFPAIADLIQILLGNPGDNEAQLNDLFDTHLNDSSASNENRRAELLVYKGLFLHLKAGYENEATAEWLKAQEIVNVDLHFDTLLHCHGRYKWPPGYLSISGIRETVQLSKADSNFSHGKEIEYEKLFDTLRKAEEKRQAFEANRNTGGSASHPGGFGGRGGEASRSQAPVYHGDHRNGNGVSRSQSGGPRQGNKSRASESKEQSSLVKNWR